MRCTRHPHPNEMKIVRIDKVFGEVLKEIILTLHIDLFVCWKNCVMVPRLPFIPCHFDGAEGIIKFEAINIK